MKGRKPVRVKLPIVVTVKKKPPMAAPTGPAT
jgi:hypothetical protein